MMNLSMMDDESIETIVIVAIGILLLVFVGSLIALIVICCQRQNYLRKHLFFGKHFIGSGDHRKLDNTYLIANNNNGMNGPNCGHFGTNGHGQHNGSNNNNNNMELDDVRLHPNIDQILSDSQWVDDATGLIPHCLAVLKGCHHLTERLVAATMATMPRFTESEQRVKLFEIGAIAPTISPRVDDVVEAMYPPLDPRLLESRCLSLLLSVSRLAIVITYTCAIRGKWIEDELKGLELQLKILRDAGQVLLNAENGCLLGTGTTDSDKKPEPVTSSTAAPVSTSQITSVTIVPNNPKNTTI